MKIKFNKQHLLILLFILILILLNCKELYTSTTETCPSRSLVIQFTPGKLNTDSNGKPNVYAGFWPFFYKVGEPNIPSPGDGAALSDLQENFSKWTGIENQTTPPIPPPTPGSENSLQVWDSYGTKPYSKYGANTKNPLLPNEKYNVMIVSQIQNNILSKYSSPVSTNLVTPNVCSQPKDLKNLTGVFSIHGSVKFLNKKIPQTSDKDVIICFFQKDFFWIKKKGVKASDDFGKASGALRVSDYFQSNTDPKKQPFSSVNFLFSYKNEGVYMNYDTQSEDDGGFFYGSPGDSGGMVGPLQIGNYLQGDNSADAAGWYDNFNNRVCAYNPKSKYIHCWKKDLSDIFVFKYTSWNGDVTTIPDSERFISDGPYPGTTQKFPDKPAGVEKIDALYIDDSGNYYWILGNQFWVKKYGSKKHWSANSSNLSNFI